MLRLLEIETSQPDLESIEKQLIEETQPDKEYLPIDVSERVRKDVFWNGNIICDYGGCNIGWKSIKKRGIFMLFNYIPWIYKVIIEILNTIDIISIRPTIQ